MRKYIENHSTTLKEIKIDASNNCFTDEFFSWFSSLPIPQKQLIFSTDASYDKPMPPLEYFQTGLISPDEWIINRYEYGCSSEKLVEAINLKFPHFDISRSMNNAKDLANIRIDDFSTQTINITGKESESEHIIKFFMENSKILRSLAIHGVPLKDVVLDETLFSGTLTEISFQHCGPI